MSNYYDYFGTLKAKQASTGRLGTVVSWKVPSSVPIQVLRKALEDAGLDVSLASDMKPRNALLRALREMSKSRVIRQLRQDGNTLVFQFTVEHLSKYEATYSKEAELTLNLDTGSVWCTDVTLESVATNLLGQHLNKRLTSDLTRLVQRVYDSEKAALIPIRDQGGAYFVPDSHSALVDKTRALLEAIGGELLALDVALGSQRTSADVSNIVAEWLHGMIGELQESCKDVTADSRKDVIQNRTAKIGELRRMLESSRGLLLGLAGTIESELQGTEKALIANLKKSMELQYA